jgi:hypothetical protein
MNNVEQKAIHIRRCHLCGVVSEIEANVVIKCQSCGKHFAPFLFFNEKAAMGLDSDIPEVRALGADWQYLLQNQYPPLAGLAVYW